MRFAAALSLGLMLCGVAANAAQAADRPPFPPSRDVAVTYRVNAKADGAPDTATLAFSVALQKLHAEGGPGAAIVDLPQKSVVVLLSDAHVAMRMPAGRGIDHILSMGSHGDAQRVGTDRVAGYACTVWRFSSKDGNGTACVTDDGVPLRGEGGDGKGHGSFEATAVTYGPQSPRLFEVPPGFHQVELPSGMGHPGRPTP